MLELHTSEDEMAALEAKYCNDTGFNYMVFFSELMPQEPLQFMYMERLKGLRKTNEGKRLPEIDAKSDLEALLFKIKTKVSKKAAKYFCSNTDCTLENRTAFFLNVLRQSNLENRQLQIYHALLKFLQA